MNTLSKSKILKRNDDLTKMVEYGLNQKISRPIKQVKSKGSSWNILNTSPILMIVKKRLKPRPDKFGDPNFLKPAGNSLLAALLPLLKIRPLTVSMTMLKEFWPRKSLREVLCSKLFHTSLRLFLPKRQEAMPSENIQQQCQPNLLWLWGLAQ